MPSSIQIVQSVEYEVESFEPSDVELRIFYVGVMCFELNVRIELRGGLFRNLIRRISMARDALKMVVLTNALDFLMCSCLKRNCRFRLLKSMVSRSTIWISPKPVRTRFLRSSHPIPPAPTSKIRDYEGTKVSQGCEH